MGLRSRRSLCAVVSVFMFMFVLVFVFVFAFMFVLEDLTCFARSASFVCDRFLVRVHVCFPARVRLRIRARISGRRDALVVPQRVVD